MKRKQMRQKIAELIRDHIIFSPQVDGYVMHGELIDKIIDVVQEPMTEEILEMARKDFRPDLSDGFILGVGYATGKMFNMKKDGTS